MWKEQETQMFKLKNFNKRERLKMRMEHFLTFVLFRKLPKMLKRGTKSELLSIYREYYPISRQYKKSCLSQKIIAEIIVYAVQSELYEREIMSDEFATITSSKASVYAILTSIQEKARREFE